MKLHPDRIDGVNVIAGYTESTITVNGQPWRESLLLPARGAVAGWSCERFEDLTAEHFQAVAALKPELVIFGSGARLRFAKPELLRPLIELHVGIETMDTAAACRTYNILVAEGRDVVAALLLQSV
ncbi:Mth938-like domain-containing protein [Pseudorivibacter rhizosphaerae]|uniref:Mth938-like domain-containing protein n=1 Tax=Methylibium rhizosphaerae TaxID=2570323 RepID=UPI00112B6ABA